ncbi:GIY-YIG nuclease family protein [Oceanivirga miroungae]|uniref:Excinuclease ABC subunit C n=1 Tax=Oceanivirga miroungae TaxID=1130046 RepID=A0A6I8M6S7_9FUSO|nr:GIY-YIG nuclease family protein [Oceanivirga miroungae]VWL85612.1 excinuclease ABC subunit C [Oceanivirga miroungae]
MKIDRQKIPESAGVYLMKDINKKIIYIGKAKNLRNRVSSYFIGAHNIKTEKLVKNIKDIEFFLCNNELEAFILENNLIKKYKPKYNILLKDEKTYPYIKITKDNLPKLKIERKVLKDKSMYFGPYPNMNKKKLHSILLKSFDIYECGYSNLDKIYDKPCMNYHIKRCNGICVNKSLDTITYYKKPFNNLIKFLENKDTSILKSIENNMMTYTKNMQFEKAIIEKEKLEILSRLSVSQVIESTAKIFEDVFYIKRINDKVYASILKVINGKVLDKKIYTFNEFIEDDNLINIISMYYNDNILPNRIILNEEFLDEVEILKTWFIKEKNKNIKIIIPKIKSRSKDLLELSKKNLMNV